MADPSRTPDQHRDPSTRSTITRRRLMGAGAAAGAAALTAGAATVRAADAAGTATDADVLALEHRYGVTIGLAARSLGTTGRTIEHRDDVRFPMLSTFKTVAAAALLRAGVDLDRAVRFGPDDVVVNSPVTGARASAGRGVMTYGELADAALRYSDNTAGNLVLQRLGGPHALTTFFRSIGDRTSRLDRDEPDLNQAVPGDERDTTTAAAMARTYRRLLRGPVLTTRDRWLLQAWLEASTTSTTRLRAALPPGWWAADKTGGGDYGTVNDVGLILAPDGREISFAALTRASETDPTAVGDPALMVDLGALLVDRLG